MSKHIALYCFHGFRITFNKKLCYYRTVIPHKIDMNKGKRYDYCRYSHGIKVVSLRYGFFNFDKSVLGTLDINVI